MSKTNLRAGAAPFAHLLSRFTGAARAEEENPENQETEEARKARRAEEDEQRKEEDARRAEEDERRQEEDARRAEEDGTDPEETSDPAPEDKGKKGKKGKKADDEDQDPEADDGDETDECEEDGQDEKEASAFRRGLARGRARENARAARIFSHPAAAARPDLAATLAFTTRNNSAEAGRLMAAATAGSSRPRSRSLDDRMGARSDARPGGAGSDGKPSLAAQIIAAGKRRRGEA